MRKALALGLALLAPPALAGEAEDALAAAEMFRDLTPLALAEIAAFSSLRPTTPGEMLIRQGADNDRLLLIAAGTAEVRSGAAVLATIAAGATVGEISFVDGRPATADVVAGVPGKVLEIPARPLRAYFARDPASGYRVMENIARQISRYYRK